MATPKKPYRKLSAQNTSPKRNAKKAKKKIKQPKSAFIGKKNSPQKWLLFLNKYIALIAILGVLIPTFITLYPYAFPKSDKENFDDAYTLKGELKSPSMSEVKDVKKFENLPDFRPQKVNDSFPKLTGLYVKGLSSAPNIDFIYGTNTYGITQSQLVNGFPFEKVQKEIAGHDCVNTNLILIIRDDRLYVSAKFIDIESGQEVGYMDFNHWTLYKGTFLDYHPDPDEKKFEVLDKRGDVLFSLAFMDGQKRPTFNMAGYFVDSAGAMVVTNDAVRNTICTSKNDSDWKQQTFKAIKSIKSVF